MSDSSGAQQLLPVLTTMASSGLIGRQGIKPMKDRPEEETPFIDKEQVDRFPPSLIKDDSADKRIVTVRLAFLKVGEIDTVKEQYSADVFYQAKWREPTLDKKSPDELKAFDFKNGWNPGLYIVNELSEKKSTVTQKAILNERGEAIVIERRKMRGDFLENLELQRFPFDVQDLSVTIVSTKPDTEVDFVADEEEPSSVNIGTFADQQEWKLFTHVEDNKTVVSEFINYQHPAMRFTCHAARRAGFFCYNTLFVMFLICSMSFGTFASGDCYDARSRIGMTYTLVLTLSAYKMAANQGLPKISYLTYLDKYFLMCLSYLAVLVGWHSLVSKLLCPTKDSYFYVNATENWVILGFFICYVLAKGAFFGFLVYVSWKSQRVMKQKDAEFKLRLAAKAENLKRAQAELC